MMQRKTMQDLQSNRLQLTLDSDSSSRRGFLAQAGGAIAAGTASKLFAAEPTPGTLTEQKQKSGATTAPLFWGNLLHVSYNMWCDRIVDQLPGMSKARTEVNCRKPYLRCDDRLWQDLTTRMAEVGMNLLLIDLGDGIRYESHPEIAVTGAWSPQKLGAELARLRKLGLEPIPKLNFSTAHDTWLGPYRRQVSTPTYYKVCSELIAEVAKLFDKPRFFHLGYDEETAGNQVNNDYVVVRQHELWWHDFDFFIAEVERHGVRPWIWSDYAWKHRDEFLQRTPKSVLQSNWYYGATLKETETAVKLYGELERHGFDQAPTGSNFEHAENFGETVKYCRRIIAPERLKGFVQTPWRPTLEQFRRVHLEAIAQVAAVIRS
jgi:hypothetical protein